MKPDSMSDERFEDPAGWTADELLDVICEDDAADISRVSDDALRGAIPVAQTRGLAIPLGALEHENGRRAVLRGQAAPENPEPLPPVRPPHEYPEHPDEALVPSPDAAARLAESSSHDGGRAGQLIYTDTFMLPAEISLQTAVEIETFLSEHGEARLNAAEGTILYEAHCEDLWEACEVAHKVCDYLQEHGIEAEVDRDLLRERNGDGEKGTTTDA